MLADVTVNRVGKVAVEFVTFADTVATALVTFGGTFVTESATLAGKATDT